MMLRIIRKFVFAVGMLLITFCNPQKNEETKQPNILFISVDDLRPDLGCYGNKTVHTPNLDNFASQAVLFKNHYVQVPTCGASRNCLLTGMRPYTRAQLNNNIIRNTISKEPEGENPETFIHHLKRNGYYTLGIGKISHYPDGLIYDKNVRTAQDDDLQGKRELPYSWNELTFDPGKWGTAWHAFFGYASGESRRSLDGQSKPYEKGMVDDLGYPDGLTAQLAIKKLRELKERQQPFFLGVGFFKPHLPFTAPDEYWDLYNRDSINISPVPDIPENINTASLHNNGEFHNYKKGEELPTINNRLSNDYARKLRQAYYSSISYVDRQIGHLIEEVENLGLENNTIIVVWGDHGWQLGDQRIWGKHTLFEKALKSVLIVKVPGVENHTVKQIVETVDIYPTLIELCNLDLAHPVDGKSLVNLIKNTGNEDEGVAYGYYRNGISLRTDRYRLTKYFRQEEPTIELYDHQNDPHESVNVADQYPEVVNELMPLLEKGNTGLYQNE